MDLPYMAHNHVIASSTLAPASKHNASVAQLVERTPDKGEVTGSSPVRCTNTGMKH